MKRGVNGNTLNMCGITQNTHYPMIEGSDDGQGCGTESESVKLECSDDENQIDYRGVVDTTVSGRTCQKWSSQEPHHHEYTKEKYPYGGIARNFCRNPSQRSDGGVWCYTTDPSKGKEDCNVSNCSNLKWCELFEQEFQNCIEASSGFEDLNNAKKVCYQNDGR